MSTEISQPTSICLVLEECGESGSGFHNRNNPSDPYQRSALLDLGSEFLVQADLALVVHGFETPGGDPATLIYVDYSLVSESRTRNFRGAAVEFRFFKVANPQGTQFLEPEVIGVYPIQEFHNITPAEKTVTSTVTGNIGAGFTGIVQAGGGITYGTTQTAYLQSKATIIGTKKFSNRYNYSIKDIARWKITENPSDPGIPTHFTTVILLRRKTSDPFAATIRIDADVDTRQKAEEVWDKFWGNKPVVDPIYFDPSLEPRGSMLVPEGLDTQNLKMFWDKQIIGSS
ncbi:hypothetical protein HOY82DRAFT_597214 [Tuber indicum]|nr:hypothetical protein HOY82DRAFT_597214 [Tuber indicum]